MRFAGLAEARDYYVGKKDAKFREIKPALGAIYGLNRPCTLSATATAVGFDDEDTVRGRDVHISRMLSRSSV